MTTNKKPHHIKFMARYLHHQVEFVWVKISHTHTTTCTPSDIVNLMEKKKTRSQTHKVYTFRYSLIKTSTSTPRQVHNIMCTIRYSPFEQKITIMPILFPPTILGSMVKGQLHRLPQRLSQTLILVLCLQERLRHNFLLALILKLID